MVKQEEQKENTDEEQLQTNEIQADLIYVVKICVELVYQFYFTYYDQPCDVHIYIYFNLHWLSTYQHSYSTLNSWPWSI